MVNITELLATRQLKEITMEALEAIEDYFEGGENVSNPVTIPSRVNG